MHDMWKLCGYTSGGESGESYPPAGNMPTHQHVPQGFCGEDAEIKISGFHD